MLALPRKEADAMRLPRARSRDLEMSRGHCWLALTVLVSVAAGASLCRHRHLLLRMKSRAHPLGWATFLWRQPSPSIAGISGFDNVILRSAGDCARALGICPLRSAHRSPSVVALACGGYRLLQVMAGEHLATLPWLTIEVTQSAILLASLAIVAPPKCLRCLRPGPSCIARRRRRYTVVTGSSRDLE